MSAFGKKVRDIRLKAGLNQEAFAAAIGVRQSTVSRWEKMKKGQTPEAGVLSRIADFAGLKDAFSLIREDTAGRANLLGFIADEVRGEAETAVWRKEGWISDKEYYELCKKTGQASADPVVLYRINDGSMNRIFSPQTIVFVMLSIFNDDARFLAGDRLLVVRRNSKGMFETIVRELRLDPDGHAWLWPSSTLPDFQMPLQLSEDRRLSEGLETKILGVVMAAFIFEPYTLRRSDGKISADA